MSSSITEAKIAADVKSSKDLRRRLREMNYASLINLKKLQGSTSSLPPPPKHTPSPTGRLNIVVNKPSTPTTPSSNFIPSNLTTILDDEEATSERVLDDGLSCSSQSSQSSSDSVVLQSATEYSSLNHLDKNVEIIVHHPHLMHGRHQAHHDGARVKARSFGSILATGPDTNHDAFANTATAAAAAAAAAATTTKDSYDYNYDDHNKPQKESVDIHVHTNIHNPRTLAIKGTSTLDTVRVTTNDLYDLRILSDNPRDFSNTDTVLKNVELGEEARTILRAFKDERERRKEGKEERREVAFEDLQCQMQDEVPGIEDARGAVENYYGDGDYVPDYGGNEHKMWHGANPSAAAELTLFEYDDEGRGGGGCSEAEGKRQQAASTKMSTKDADDLLPIGRQHSSSVTTASGSGGGGGKWRASPPRNPRPASTNTVNTPTNVPSEEALLNLTREVESLHEELVSLGLQDESLSFSLM
jgi:hypothetical protein